MIKGVDEAGSSDEEDDEYPSTVYAFVPIRMFIGSLDANECS